MKDCNNKKCNDNVIIRKPNWLKIRLYSSESYSEVSKIVSENSLHTICSSGKCPNMAECWSRGTATFMVMGEICTRKCKFCATMSGKPLPLDENEPKKLARSIMLMNLKHAVVTSVDRDDLSDGGAEHWRRCVMECRSSNPDTSIEVLIPDFDGNTKNIDTILSAKPHIVGHNIETVRRLTPQARSRAKYDTSLSVISHIASKGFMAKSGIMVGIGESEQEVLETIDDLKSAGCSLLTIGQYLAPTKGHLLVDRYVTPEEFDRYKEHALSIGFEYAECGPMVRSSYMAENAAKKVRLNLKDLL